MISATVATLVVAQEPATMQQSSPLQNQADALADSVVDVQYEFIKQVVPDYGVTKRAFTYYSSDKQRQVALNAYYLAALKRATLLYQHVLPLANIINSFDGKNQQEVSLKFEQTYFDIFRRWPPMVPVDVQALTARMLDEQTVR